MMNSVTVFPVPENVIAGEELAGETNHQTFLSPFLLTLSAVFTTICRLWTNYYPPGESGNEAPIISRSPLSFVIGGLFSFAEMRSQGPDAFPFGTHPQASMVAVTSLIIYGFAFAAEEVISAARLGPSSVYAIAACLGRMCSLCLFVVSLASLFYF